MQSTRIQNPNCSRTSWKTFFFKILKRWAYQRFLLLKLRTPTNWIKIEWINVKKFKDFGLSYPSG